MQIGEDTALKSTHLRYLSRLNATRVFFDPLEIAESHDHVQPRMLFATGARRAVAAMTQVSLGSTTLHYTELNGQVTNLAASTGRELVLGTLVQGATTVFLNGDRYEMRPWESILFLPGDEALQFLKDSDLFTLRIPISKVIHFRLASRPFRLRLGLRRLIKAEDAEDYRRLLVFFCDEFDRTYDRGNGMGMQSNSIGQALLTRVESMLGESMNENLGFDPELARICLACEDLFPSGFEKPLTAKDMALATASSVRQLYRAFDVIVNSTPAAYVARRRTYHARALLLSLSDDPIGEAVLSCGFGSKTRLRRAYELEFGEAPEDTLARRQALVRTEQALVSTS